MQDSVLPRSKGQKGRCGLMNPTETLTPSLVALRCLNHKLQQRPHERQRTFGERFLNVILLQSSNIDFSYYITSDKSLDYKKDKS